METEKPREQAVKLSTVPMMTEFEHDGKRYRTAGPPQYSLPELNEGKKRGVICMETNKLIDIPYSALVLICQ